MQNTRKFAKRGGQSVRWTVAPVESLLTPKRKATQIAVINPVHCRLTPTRCFRKTLPTL
ncbi:MAG: hypothetical protein LBK82_05655 [Planctomycetaceae bacterium]|nr:hypothetical protein [Planctomycetaceae bacterium]